VEMILIDSELCKGCELCVGFCPKHLIVLDIRFNSTGFHPAVFKDEDILKCTSCGICAEMCPEMAITVVKKKQCHGKKNTL